MWHDKKKPSQYPHPRESSGAWVAHFLVWAPSASIEAEHFHYYPFILGIEGVYPAPRRKLSAIWSPGPLIPTPGKPVAPEWQTSLYGHHAGASIGAEHFH